MTRYLVTITERDGRRWTVGAIASSSFAAADQVLASLGRIVGIWARPEVGHAPRRA